MKILYKKILIHFFHMFTPTLRFGIPGFALQRNEMHLAERSISSRIRDENHKKFWIAIKKNKKQKMQKNEVTYRLKYNGCATLIYRG